MCKLTSSNDGYHICKTREMLYTLYKKVLFAAIQNKWSFLIFNCSTILAAIHFNYNLKREMKVDAHANPRLKVTYPKYKQGEATVRKVKVVQNYGKGLRNKINYIRNATSDILNS